MLLLAPLALRAQIPTAQVTRVGFPSTTMSGAGALVREGQWAPVITELQLPGSGVFEGSLRIVSEDLDGDLAEYITPNVLINPEAGLKRYWTYAVSFERRTSASDWLVDVLDSNGAVILRQPVSPSEVLSADALLVVDISEQQVSKLRILQVQSNTPPGENESPPTGTRYLHEMAVSFMPARDLPDRWIGLEAVDCLVWDRPNPGMLSEAQLDALIQWVHRGGKLVIGLGDAWAAVRESPLAAILPVHDVSTTVTAQRLRFFSQRYLAGAADPPAAGAGSALAGRGETARSRLDFSTAIPVSIVDTTRDAVVSLRDQIMPAGAPVDLISMRCIGSGRVIVCAASLRDLTTGPVKEAFFREILDLFPISTTYAKKLYEKQQGTLGIGVPKDALFSEVAAKVSFRGERTVYVLAVLLFVLVYGATATLGSWWWLRRKSLTSMSWTVFAIFAVAASALSLGAVGISGGLRQGVESVQVVDLVAAERKADCFGWFGYGSALRQVIDLNLGPASGSADIIAEAPDAPPRGFVRSLSLSSPAIVTFATPARYTLEPGAGQARGVLVRATLKQFEGAWSGDIDGSILGQLTADRGTGELISTSWIQNDLPVRLSGGYLLYLDPRSTGGNFEQLDRAGMPGRHWRGPDDFPAAMHIVSVALPPLDSGERTRPDFARVEYGEVNRRLAAWSAVAANKDHARSDRPDLVTLWQLQQYWANNALAPPGTDEFAVRGARSLLLASTLRWYQPNADPKDLDTVGNLLTSDGMPHLDVTHWLVRGQALLLAWADAPGPAALVRDGRPVRSRSGLTLYRVRIPIRFSGDAPREPDFLSQPGGTP